MLELGSGFHPDFTGRENIFMNGAILGLSEREIRNRFDDIVDFAEVKDFIDMPVKSYSSGMQMRLGFAIAIHVDCEILLLDEILAVGDEAFQRKCFGMIFDFKREGGTLLFVSHDATMIERVCSRVLLVRGGAIVADGTPQDVLSTYHQQFTLSGQREAHSGSSPRSDQAGGPNVLINAVRVLGQDREPTESLRSAEPAHIELDVSIVGVLDEPPVFGIAVHSVDGQLMYGTNTRMHNLRMPTSGSALNVRFSIPCLHLHAGRFQVTAAAHSHDESIVYQWLDRAADFDVFQSATGIGVVDLSGSWSVTEAVMSEQGRSVGGTRELG